VESLNFGTHFTLDRHCVKDLNVTPAPALLFWLRLECIIIVEQAIRQVASMAVKRNSQGPGRNGGFQTLASIEVQMHLHCPAT
jgi:hypothetical protein